MKHFNPAITNHLFEVSFLLKPEGMYMILKFKKRRVQFLRRQYIFIGKIYFKRGYKTFDERFDVVKRWASQIDFDELKEKFFEAGAVRRPVIHFNNEMRIDFNTALEEAFEENLLENSWRKQWED